jgi:RNA polymerase-binding transcription factor DksA
MSEDPTTTPETMRTQLLAERTRLAAQLSGLERTFDDLVAAADVEPADDEHDPSGTTAYERAQVSSLAGIARARLAEVERAIVAVDTGDFGSCAACGEAIGAERLEALPGTTLCVGCAAAGRAPGDPPGPP